MITTIVTTASYNHRCYYWVSFLDGEIEAWKSETIYSRCLHGAVEVRETHAANRERNGPEQQRKLPLASRSPLAQQEVDFQRLLYQRQKPPPPCRIIRKQLDIVIDKIPLVPALWDSVIMSQMSSIEFPGSTIGVKTVISLPIVLWGNSCLVLTSLHDFGHGA